MDVGDKEEKSVESSPEATVENHHVEQSEAESSETLIQEEKQA